MRAIHAFKTDTDLHGLAKWTFSRGRTIVAMAELEELIRSGWLQEENPWWGYYGSGARNGGNWFVP